MDFSLGLKLILPFACVGDLSIISLKSIVLNSVYLNHCRLRKSQLIMRFLILFCFAILTQTPDEYRFGYHNKKFVFNLPYSSYELKEEIYTEGVFRTLVFTNGVLLLHVGSNVRKPIFSSREYVVDQSIKTESLTKTIGHKRKSNPRLYWGEVSIMDGENNSII
jgi:hypothetical protein